MNTAQRIRCLLLAVVMLVMVSVSVFYRQEPLSVTVSARDPFVEKPLTLRKNLALHIGDRTAAENQQFVPIPDNAVPIQWERVEESRASMAPTAPGSPNGGATRHGGQRPLVGGESAARPGGPPVAARNPSRSQPEPRYHRIVDGETLRDIAAQYLGSPDRFMDLFYANRAVLPHPDVLPLGAKIVIPDADRPSLPPVRTPWPSQDSPGR